MKRWRKIAGAGTALLIWVALFALPARAQDASSSGGAANLPAKPEPAAKPDNFPVPNPYEYPQAGAAPVARPKEIIDTIPEAIATELEPYGAPEPETGQAVSRNAQNEIRVYTNEVIAPVTVTDKRGQLVLDLEQKDFHIFDNGVEQKIVHWDLGGDRLAVALVIETSTHIQLMAPVIRGMGSIFTETVMALNGEAAVITFDSTVDVRQPFTTDHDAIQRAVAAVQFEAPEIRLHDAMAAAVDLLQAQPTNYRRVVLVVGESQDVGSDAKLRLVLRAAQLANITIYGIGVSSTKGELLATMHQRSVAEQADDPSLPEPDVHPWIAPSGVAEHAATLDYYDFMTPAIWLATRGVNKIKDHQLELAVASTGGVHHHAYRDRAIRNALDQIGSELHAQYIVGYSPSAQPADGVHEISVTVARPNTSVRTRPGYFLAPAANLSVPPSRGESTQKPPAKSSPPE
jgi:VWFA-related protein